MYNTNEIKKAVRNFLESIKEKITGMDDGSVDYDGELYNELAEMWEEVKGIYNNLRYGEIDADEMDVAYDIMDGAFDYMIA